MHETHEQDPELTGIISSIDRLARAEQQEPGPDFERSIALATRPGVAGTITPESTKTSSARVWWSIAAASIAVVFGMFVFRPAQPPTASIEQPAVSLTMLETELEDFLFIDDLAGSQAIVTDNSFVITESQDTPDEILFDLLGMEGSSL